MGFGPKQPPSGTVLAGEGARATQEKSSRPNMPCDGPRMNPSVDVGTRRDPLGISAWRSIAHRILVRVESPFILHWFKNRLPPSPTWQAGFQSGC
jgi:hypothetical protein